jgi:hypothetical protein
VEVTLALGVAAFCLIAVFGLMPVGVQTNRNATSETFATRVLAAVIGDMRNTPKAYNASITYYVGDTVMLNGICYMAIATTAGNAPPNSTYWSTGSQCPKFGITLGTPATLYFDGEGRFSTSLQVDSRYRVSITFPLSPTGLSYADVRVTWPAAATSANASGSVETFAAFDRN